MLRKKFVMLSLVAVLGAVRGANLFAQFAVLDSANLLQAIETTYQYYQQVQNTIEQVQNTYKQIDQAYQQMKTINFNEMKDLGKNFDGMKDNPFEVISGVHDSAHDITREVNKQMNKVNDLQDALNAESISFGRMKVSVADLCGAGDPEKTIVGFTENAWKYTKEQKEEAVKGYTEGLSYKEKEAIHRHFGMSPRNYATIELGKHELARLTKTSNLLGTEKAIEDQINDIIAQQGAINKMNTEGLPEGSVYAATQMTNSTLGVLLRQIGLMHGSLNRAIGLKSQEISAKETENAVKAQQDMENREAEQKALANKGIAIDEINQM